jgi:hypothetical protein
LTKKKKITKISTTGSHGGYVKEYGIDFSYDNDNWIRLGDSFGGGVLAFA